MSELLDRVRSELGGIPDIGEIRMFGGYCFTLNGNMLVGTMNDGTLLVRVGADGMATALIRPGAGRMEMGGRTMGGFVTVDPDVLDDAGLRGWISTAMDLVATMPPKAAKTRRRS